MHQTELTEIERLCKHERTRLRRITSRCYCFSFR